jgi:hypothetical protein
MKKNQEVNIIYPDYCKMQKYISYINKNKILLKMYLKSLGYSLFAELRVIVLAFRDGMYDFRSNTYTL